MMVVVLKAKGSLASLGTKVPLTFPRDSTSGPTGQARRGLKRLFPHKPRKRLFFLFGILIFAGCGKQGGDDVEKNEQQYQEFVKEYSKMRLELNRKGMVGITEAMQEEIKGLIERGELVEVEIDLPDSNRRDYPLYSSVLDKIKATENVDLFILENIEITIAPHSKTDVRLYGIMPPQNWPIIKRKVEAVIENDK